MTLCVIVLCASALAAVAGEPTVLADRAAIERVYYNHRIGQKPPFEVALPPAALHDLVRLDLRKEAVLAQVYGVAITPAMLQAEVDRIDQTTRGPDMLVEIKAALGNDAARFAGAFAKPLLVERLLRQRFETDDALHAPLHREVEKVRSGLLAARSAGAGYDALLSTLRRGHADDVAELTWQLGVRAPEARTKVEEELEIRKRFGPDAQLLSPSRGTPGSEALYFEDLPMELQTVLLAQVRRAGDISAVIETPGNFLLYIAKNKSETMLSVAALRLPKLNYDQWLDGQAARLNVP